MSDSTIKPIERSTYDVVKGIKRDPVPQFRVPTQIPAFLMQFASSLWIIYKYSGP